MSNVQAVTVRGFGMVAVRGRNILFEDKEDGLSQDNTLSELVALSLPQ
jgi:hypothetical protein